MKSLIAKIISNRAQAPGFYHMRVESSYLSRSSRPGQFVEARCSDSVYPLLRRPLGVHRISGSGIEMLYQVVGRGTEILSQARAGETIDLIGPLGNGFDLQRTKDDRRSAILIAGGIGVAPLVALAEELVLGKKRDVYVLIGAKTRGHVLCEREFKSLGCDVKVATEDGSKGRKGLATDLLKDILETQNPKLRRQRRRMVGHFREMPRPITALYACGPTPMLKAVAHIAAGHRIPCQVSLEERMACGVGVCLGCPVKIKATGEYKMVCKDGPVFDAGEISW